MTDTNITITSAANFIPEVWSQEILRAVENKLVMANLVKRFDADVAEHGDIVHVPNLANVTATYKVLNEDIPQSTNVEDVTNIPVTRHGAVRVDIEDIVKVQSKYDLRSEYTKKMGYSIGLLIDDTLIALYSGLSQTVGSTASNVGIAKSYVLGAIRRLDTANAPQDDRHWVVEAYGRQDLFNIDDFVRYDAAGQGGSNNAIIKGRIGELYGVDVHYSENVHSSGSIIYSMLFHKEAFALAMQKDLKVESEYEVKRAATVVTARAIWGEKEYRDTFGTVVQYGNA